MSGAGSAWDGMAWTNAPLSWTVEADGTGVAEAAPGTDFWQTTFYGFQRDNGHGLLRPRSGDFSAHLTVEADYEALYDQAGLMLRGGPESWIKFGVEMTDGAAHLSVVVTNFFSDWSARPITLNGPLTLRATRLGAAVLLQHRSEKTGWQMARLAPFIPGDVGIGPYLCTPERTKDMAAFKARFRAFDVSDPVVRDLHADP